MKIVNKGKLLKLKRKNRGNSKLIKAIDRLILDFEDADWRNKTDVKIDRPDADCVHSEGFYFFDINIHRTMVLVVFDKGEVIIVWAGTHDEYNLTFKGNKKTIEKWLRNQQIT